MFSVKCPICNNPLIKKVVLEDQKYYLEYKCKCAGSIEVFTYRLDQQTEKPLKIDLYLDMGEKSYLRLFWYEEGYLKINPDGRWWEVILCSISANSIAQQSLAKGHEYLSPEDAWQILNRCKKLLLFL